MLSISISNNGMIFGFSSKYWFTSFSFNPSIMLTASAYKGMDSVFFAILSLINTLIFAFPFRMVRVFFLQFCFMFAVRSHGLPKSKR